MDKQLLQQIILTTPIVLAAIPDIASAIAPPEFLVQIGTSLSGVLAVLVVFFSTIGGIILHRMKSTGITISKKPVPLWVLVFLIILGVVAIIIIPGLLR